MPNFGVLFANIFVLRVFGRVRASNHLVSLLFLLNGLRLKSAVSYTEYCHACRVVVILYFPLTSIVFGWGSE